MTKLHIFGAIALAASLCACSNKAEVTTAAEEPVNEPSPVEKALDLFYNSDYRDAISYSTEVMDAEGESVDMLTIRGIANSKLGNTYLAFRDLNAAVKMEYSAYTLYNLGTALRMHGHCARSADAFEKAAALDPSNQAIQIALVSSYTCYGDTASASEVFLKLVNNFPQDAIAFTNAAILKSTVESFDEAKTAAQKAITMDAFYKPAYKVLSFACQQLGDSQCANQANSEYKKLNGQNFRQKKVLRKPKN